MADDPDGIDPRFADRRDEVQREHRRRLAFRLGVLLGLLALAGALVALARSPLLDVDRVEVSGADRSRRDAVLDATAGLVGTPLLDVDVGEVGGTVRSLPWVASVHVRRDWPSAVVITVTERRAVARVAAGDQRWQVIDADGRVLAEVDATDGDLLELMGIPPAAEPGDELEGAADMLEVAGAMTAELRARVDAVRRGEAGELELQLEPDGVVRLGDTSQLGDKMLALATLLARVDDRCVERIDVRVPAAPTIVRVDACAQPATTTTAAWSPDDTTATTAWTAPTTPAATATSAPTTVVTVSPPTALTTSTPAAGTE